MTRHWINAKLTAPQRDLLVDWLMERSANPSGELIQAAIGELFPDKDPPSANSCRDWKNGNWKFELHRRQIREDSEVARILADASNNGADLANANVALAQAVYFEELRAIREGKTDDETGERTDAIALAIARLAKASQNERALVAKLRELEAAEAERKAKADQLREQLAKSNERGGLTPDDLAEIERQLKLL